MSGGQKVRVIPRQQTPLGMGQTTNFGLIKLTGSGRLWGVIYRSAHFRDEKSQVEYSTWQFLPGFEKVTYGEALDKIIELKGTQR